MGEPAEAEMQLSKVTAVALFLWYILVFIFAVVVLANIFFDPQFMLVDVTFHISLEGAVAAGLSSSALFYVRKLYKGVFAQPAGQFSVGSHNAIEFATFIYYLSRPLFAVLFSAMVVVTGALFIHSATSQTPKFSAGFLFINMLVSAYGAAATGRAVQHLEQLGREKIKTFGGGA